jgi:platelet-activating factor acetylhydrolase
VGTSHSSITDAGLIAGSTLLSFFDSGSANATIDPLVGILQYVRVSQDFIDFLKNGTRNDLLASNVTDPEYVIKPNTTTSTGNDLQYWEIHEAPLSK